MDEVAATRRDIVVPYNNTSLALTSQHGAPAVRVVAIHRCTSRSPGGRRPPLLATVGEGHERRRR
jgi:hypothetical protein